MSGVDFEHAFAFACFELGWVACKPYVHRPGLMRYTAYKFPDGRFFVVNAWEHDDGSVSTWPDGLVEFKLDEFERHKVAVEDDYTRNQWLENAHRDREWRGSWYKTWEILKNRPAEKTKSPAPSAPEEQKMTTKVENSTIKNTLSAAKDAAVEGAKLAAAQQAAHLIRDTVRGYMPASYVVAVSSPLGEAAESFLVPMLIHAAVDLVPNVPNVDKVKSAAEYAMTAEAKDRLGVLLAQLAPMLRDLGSKMGDGA